MYQTYAEIRKESQGFQEKNDCAVIAVALAADVPYARAWEILRQEGRKPRHCTPTAFILSAIRKAGQNLRDVTPLIQKYGNTVKNLEDCKFRDTYLIFTSGHVLVLKKGKAIDWTSGRKNRITAVYRIES